MILVGDSAFFSRSCEPNKSVVFSDDYEIFSSKH